MTCTDVEHPQSVKTLILFVESKVVGIEIFLPLIFTLQLEIDYMTLWRDLGILRGCLIFVEP